MPAGTPNDGFPENWHPVESEEMLWRRVSPGAVPSMGPPSADRFFATSIPLPMQLEGDVMGTVYPGGLASYRIMPPIASGNPDLNSAIKSFKG